MILLSGLLGMLVFRGQSLRLQAERRMILCGILCYSTGFLAYVLVRNLIYAALPELMDLPAGLLHSLLNLDLIQTLLFLLLAYIPVLILLSNAISGEGLGFAVSKQEYSLHISALLPLWGLLFLITAPVQAVIPHFLNAGIFEVSVGYLIRSILVAVYTLWAVRYLNFLTAAQASGVFILSWITLPVFYLLTHSSIVLLSFILVPFILWGIGRFRDFLAIRSDDASIRRHLVSLNSNPEDARVHYQLGLIHLKRRNPDAACRHFDSARRIDAGHSEHSYGLGRAYEMKGEWRRALEFYEEAYRIDPECGSGEIIRELGKAHLHTGNIEKGVEHLNQFLKMRSSDPEGRYWLAVALEKTGNVSQMIGELNLIMGQVRANPRALRREARPWAYRARTMLRRARSGDQTADAL
jgi:tetratricopeptide (TPR) repeat protein